VPTKVLFITKVVSLHTRSYGVRQRSIIERPTIIVKMGKWFNIHIYSEVSADLLHVGSLFCRLFNRLPVP